MSLSRSAVTTSRAARVAWWPSRATRAPVPHSPTRTLMVATVLGAWTPRASHVTSTWTWAPGTCGRTASRMRPASDSSVARWVSVAWSSPSRMVSRVLIGAPPRWATRRGVRHPRWGAIATRRRPTVRCRRSQRPSARSVPARVRDRRPATRHRALRSPHPSAASCAPR